MCRIESGFRFCPDPSFQYIRPNRTVLTSFFNYRYPAHPYMLKIKIFARIFNCFQQNLWLLMALQIKLNMSSEQLARSVTRPCAKRSRLSQNSTSECRAWPLPTRLLFMWISPKFLNAFQPFIYSELFRLQENGLYLLTGNCREYGRSPQSPTR